MILLRFVLRRRHVTDWLEQRRCCTNRQWPARGQSTGSCASRIPNSFAESRIETTLRGAWRLASGRLPAIGVGVLGQGVERRPETMPKAAYHTASGHRAAMARCSPAWSSAMTHATPRPVRPVRTRVPLARDVRGDRGRIELVRADRRADQCRIASAGEDPVDWPRAGQWRFVQQRLDEPASGTYVSPRSRARLSVAANSGSAALMNPHTKSMVSVPTAGLLFRPCPCPSHPVWCNKGAEASLVAGRSAERQRRLRSFGAGPTSFRQARLSAPPKDSLEYWAVDALAH